MIIPASLSNEIVSIANQYIGRSFDYEKFNCVHFVREVYFKVGINFPLVSGMDFPPKEFNLSLEKFDLMPIGHCVFAKRKTSQSIRIWSHTAIIVSQNDLIHCTRHFGSGVVITSKIEFMKVYSLV